MYDDRDRERMAEILNNAIASTDFGPVVGVLTKDAFSDYAGSDVIYFHFRRFF